MRSTPFPAMECPVARTMAQLGDAWRVLIVRDALLGLRRFDEFEASLGIAPNILAKRLGALVADGLLAKRPYQTRPVRHEYVPTPKARDFALVIAALAGWGTNWLSPAGATVLLVDARSGERLDVALVGRESGRRCGEEALQFEPGPSAGPEILERAMRVERRAHTSARTAFRPEGQMGAIP